MRVGDILMESVKSHIERARQRNGEKRKITLTEEKTEIFPLFLC